METVYDFAGYTLDPRERTLVRGAARVPLRRRSFDLLVSLVRRAGALVQHATLLDEVWGVAVSTGVLKVAVRDLRVSLRDDARSPRFIEAVAGSGYRFVAEVEKRPREAAVKPTARPTAARVRRLALARGRGATAALAARPQRRGSALIGREAEVEVLRAALRGSVRVLYVHGIGGIGKTALVGALASLCAGARASFTCIDARDVASLPGEFLGALRAVVGGRGDPLARLRARRGRVVLVIDGYEHVAALDPWVRAELLPALPPRALLVLAGRGAPSAAWLGEPGWNDTLRALSLRELAAPAARRVLAARGVPAERHDAALAFTRGHPLALCLVADLAARSPEAPLTHGDAPDVVQALLARVVHEVDDERQQAALDACSLVRHVTEPLLAAMLGGTGARSLLRWLASLSFMEVAQGGVRPHDLARDVLFADLKWRDPDRLTELIGRASAHLAERLRRAPSAPEVRLADELLFLHSNHPVIGSFTPWRGADGLTIERAARRDVPALVELVARHEGRAASDLAARWLDAQAEGALLVRDGEPVPAGFGLTLDLERAAPADVEADPLARAALRHVEAHGGARRGHAILLQRFLMSRDTYQGHSPIQTILGSQCMRGYLTTPRLDWAFTCLADPEPWAPLLKAAFGAEVLPTIEHDGRRYGIFWHCFRDVAPGAWLAWLAARGVAGAGGSSTPPRVLAREDLRSAVQLGLQRMHRSGGHDDSPLLGSQLLESPVARHRRAARRARPVATLLLDAAEALKVRPRGVELHAALLHAYLEPAPTLALAAARAGVPFGTFRRRVARAIDHVVDVLWQRQSQGS